MTPYISQPLLSFKLSPGQKKCLKGLSMISICSYSLMFSLQPSSTWATITTKLLNPIIRVQAKDNLTLHQLLRLLITLFIFIYFLYLVFFFKENIFNLTVQYLEYYTNTVQQLILSSSRHITVVFMVFSFLITLF